MSTSSARPDNLEDFSRRSRAADRELKSALRTLRSLHSELVGELQWGHFDAGSLLGGYAAYLGENEFDASWVAQIAAAFRAAGSDGAIARLPDRAIKASLRAAGLDRDRRSVTFDDPVAWGSPPTTGYTNDPVNTATGNFVEVERDLLFGGLVEGLSFARTYNSRSDRVGSFGRGWSSWATARLAARPDGAAYVGPDGQEAHFPRMGDGYGPIIGVEALVEPLETGLALTWFGGEGRWEFDDAGLPVSLDRGPGTAVTLRHDANGRLAELTHPGGACVRLEWDEDRERVSGLRCSDGRRVDYSYDEDDNLVLADADAAAGARRYELDEQGRVVSVIDADGVAELVNTYDEDGRVLEQRSPFGRRTQLRYLPGRVTVTMDDDDDGPLNTYVHDAAGRLLALVDGEDRQLAISYDESGNRVSVTERSGAVTVQSYDDRSRPVRQILPTGLEIALSYDDSDRLLEVSTSAGAVTRYAYDRDERSPAQIVDAEGAIVRQDVRDGRIRRVVDADGVSLQFEFDADGNVVAVTDGDANTSRLERDEAGRVTAAISPLGRRREFAYDDRGRVVERREPGGGVWRFEYTAAGRLVATIDPGGAREEVRYGEHGERAATLDALGNATTLDYDVFGNVVAVVDPAGARWEHSYDALMRPITTLDPAGARWRREYDADGTLVATTDPAGVRQAAKVDAFGRVIGFHDGLVSIDFELDALDRIVVERRADGTLLRAEYDRCDRMTMLEDAVGAITRYEYTPGGRLARQISAAGRIDAFEHDACGRLAARIDGAGRRWELRHDADGALAEVHLPTGDVERLAYDDAGRLARRESPGEGVTTYAYDSADRVVAITDREAGTRSYEFDLAGRLAASVDANGGATRYAYDERGLLTAVTDPLGGTVVRRYDMLGRLVEIIDQLGRSSTVAYDAAGRLVEQVDGAGRKVIRSYDTAGRVDAFGPSDALVSVRRDALGRAIAFEEPGSFSHRLRWDAEGHLVERKRGELALSWAYDADGERTAIGYPDGTQTRYTHDAGGYVVGAQHPALGVIELQRDAAGRLVGANADGMRAHWRYEGGDLAQYEMQAGAQRRTATITRDPLGRVAEASVDGHAFRYAYDPAGQLLSADTPLGQYAFAYDAGGRLARESTPAGVVEYVYDAAGQLLSRAGGDGDEVRYEYDGAGRRVLESGNDLERRYRWDGFGRLAEIDAGAPGGGDRAAATTVAVDVLGELAELDGTPLLWDSADPLAPLAWDGAGAVVGEGAPWAHAQAGAARWLAPDWQGSVGDAQRDPWGGQLSAVAASGAGAAGVALGYRGELELGGDSWLRNRVYQPASRAFIGPDALGAVPGTGSASNPYHYAANDPIGHADPLGLRPVTDSELQKIRDSMDRNLLERGRDAAVDVAEAGLDALKWVGEQGLKHIDTISLVAGVLAMFPTPLAPLFGAISLGATAISTVKSARDGDIGSAVLGIVGSKIGLKGVLKSVDVKDLKAGLKVFKAENKVGVVRGLRPKNWEKRRNYLEGVTSRKEVLKAAGAESRKLGLQGNSLTAAQLLAKERGLYGEDGRLLAVPGT